MKANIRFLLSVLTLAGAFSPKCAAQDWPDLNRYRNDNRALMEARRNDPTGAQNRWEVFMGDSIIELNRQIKAYAEDNRIPFVDYYSALVDDKKGLNPAYATNSAHPSLEGYKLMEPLVIAGIEQALSHR